jgi:hypothetical protein
MPRVALLKQPKQPNNIRSHVDMILFCNYLHIHSDELDKGFVERIKKANISGSLKDRACFITRNYCVPI